MILLYLYSILLGFFLIIKNKKEISYFRTFSILEKFEKNTYKLLLPYQNFIGVFNISLSVSYLLLGYGNLFLSIIFLLSGLSLSNFLFDYVLLSKDIQYSNHLKYKIISMLKKSEKYIGFVCLISSILVFIL